jgi:hypothetical protein
LKPRLPAHPRGPAAEAGAAKRLAAALTEQARLGDALHRLAGSSAEQSAYARLRAASLRVAECDREVKLNG